MGDYLVAWRSHGSNDRTCPWCKVVHGNPAPEWKRSVGADPKYGHFLYVRYHCAQGKYEVRVPCDPPSEVTC
jgi:hypothetical protein